MEILPWPSIAFYSAFGVLVYYQRLHAHAYAGPDWQHLLLTGLAFAGVPTGLAYLVYFGWKTAWWAPVIPLAMSALATIPAILLERVVGRTALGRLSVPAWPVCAWLMFTLLPD